MTWIGLTVAAIMLWYSRLHNSVIVPASEPVALLLSGYAAFSGIFAWMLYAPRRKSFEESPFLFLFRGVTLVAPGIISFFLMPPHSPLRGWLTLGVFLITVIAVMSPVPDRFFAVPRNRSSYLRPISDTLFSNLDCLDDTVNFDHLGQVPVPASEVLSRQRNGAVSLGIPGRILSMEPVWLRLAFAVSRFSHLSVSNSR